MLKTTVKIVLPVYNEEKELEENLLKLRGFVFKNLLDYEVKIIIADNASTDQTPAIAKKIADQYRDVSFSRLEKKGRGRAIKKTWETGDADVYVYMDLDLSTDLKHLPNLINSLSKGYDLAIGSRLLSNSIIIGRTIKREILSRTYNFLIKILFQTKFSDAQCGFKAISQKTARELLPKVKDNEWFFDSELLIIAEKSGLKIYEEPVVWVDNPGSTVRVLKTVTGDLKGLLRLFTTRPWNKL